MAPFRDSWHGALAGRRHGPQQRQGDMCPRARHLTAAGLPCTRGSVLHKSDGHPYQVCSQLWPMCPERVWGRDSRAPERVVPRATDEAFAGGFHVTT